MKIKGSQGVAKWKNACIIKAEFGQIDLGYENLMAAK